MSSHQTPAAVPTEIKDLSGGEALVEALVSHGVDTVFGIPGIQLDPLFDAFYAERNQVRMVHTRHEQGAAFMAMGYAQASDRTGVFAVVLPFGLPRARLLALALMLLFATGIALGRRGPRAV